jgi:hypothetical protein
MHLRKHLAYVLVTLVGCSDGNAIAPVSGVVTLDGKPLPDARISFQPAPTGEAAGKTELGMGSYATTDAEGRYTLHTADTDAAGAVVGTHRVMISDMRTESDQDGGVVRTPPPRFPPRYSDGSLTFDVKPEGTDQANFELKSK